MAQLQFKGKTFVQNHHLLVKYHELVPVKAKSLTSKVTLHDNLIVHGDNLKALKALLPLYAGKVNCPCMPERSNASISTRPTTPATKSGFIMIASTRP